MLAAGNLPVVDLLVVAVYLLGVVALGAWFARRTRSMEAYSLGSRRVPGWAVGLSILGTYLSSISFLANPGKSYASDWRPFVFSLTLPICSWIAARWFIPFFRNKIQTTAYQHLEDRFGYWARAYAGCTLILLQIARVAVVLYLVALAMGQLLGWDVHIVILALGALTIAYTVAGGFEAVIWTDVVQSIVLIVGALACVVLLLVNIPGGWETVREVARQEDKFGLGEWDWDLTIQGFWVIFLFGIVENLKNFGIDQNYVQRFLSAKSEKEARRSLWIGGLSYIPVSAIFFLIGTLLYVYYKTSPAADLPDTPDRVFPFFIVTELPVGVTGIVVAAILAAGMSTLDSSLNTSATVWAVDFYKRRLRPDADDKALLRTTRWTTLVVGIVGTAAALLMTQAKTVLDVWWAISAILGGGMLGLFLLGMLVRRAGGRAALAATVLGVLVTAWGTAATKWSVLTFPLHPMMLGLLGTVIIVGTGWLFSRFR
jgi:SSS family solute:Na+ symporter